MLSALVLVEIIPRQFRGKPLWCYMTAEGGLLLGRDGYS